ncbi:hydrogenase formation protein HypD [Uliginosibacterium sp. 31-16]|uniref:hydrogenase formation protein HypD n=1 Tax=Uliginosibacterium sp. 31-16 TaxID=3068315 RepID=UPI00273F7BD6|nr:hydrogenase formation protein HypD [Uliginosibacterium sp. 31-16]MDP5240904.1 hydrogenase formation protein HypD [Uliginosibacterium sp. 31-16]
MKYIDEFRDGEVARSLAVQIAAEVQPGRSYRLMEFCGGHTHAISRYGLLDLLPPAVQMIHGPGCPVCVLPIGRIDSAIDLARERGVILCTYADTLRVPASGGVSLLRAKAAGADVRMVYSCDDALRIAGENPAREVVFFAIGFETTTPMTAAILKQAAALELKNFSVFCNHVLTPAAMVHIMESEGDPAHVALDGFVGPAHVSTVIGSAPYEGFAARYQKPVVISGFEPLDVMQSILMLVRQINAGRAVVENQFTRAVTREGNRKAQALVAEVFELREMFDWRGLGEVPASALQIKPAFARFDAEQRYAIAYRQVPDPKACECAAILRGHKHPRDCKVFGTACTPDHPIGACMVSSEGACAAHYTYGRFKAVSVVNEVKA